LKLATVYPSLSSISFANHSEIGLVIDQITRPLPR
jgi:hypothetical protein